METQYFPRVEHRAKAVPTKNNKKGPYWRTRVTWASLEILGYAETERQPRLKRAHSKNTAGPTSLRHVPHRHLTTPSGPQFQINNTHSPWSTDGPRTSLLFFFVDLTHRPLWTPLASHVQTEASRDPSLRTGLIIIPSGHPSITISRVPKEGGTHLTRGIPTPRDQLNKMYFSL